MRKFSREIVVDPRTGEVLRDYWQALAAADADFGFDRQRDRDGKWDERVGHQWLGHQRR
jgi:hypothetical protein